MKWLFHRLQINESVCPDAGKTIGNWRVIYRVNGNGDGCWAAGIRAIVGGVLNGI